MKYILGLLLCIVNSNFTYAQNAEIWLQFEDKSTELIGYKDISEQIKIPAKFCGLTQAHKFRSIISVMEKCDLETHAEYYLLKNGKVVGFDSAYVWDNYFDCERENKIRFRDKITDKVGFFGKDGKVVIPAIYNDAKPFFNGVAVSIKDAKKVCPDDWTGQKFDLKNCEHLIWQGGKILLINEKNEILLEFADFSEPDLLDWFSLEITNSKPEDKNRVVFKGLNGSFYSFIDLQVEFQNWFNKDFLSTLKSNEKALGNFCFDRLAVSAKFSDEIWKLFNKQEFVNKYGKSLKKRIELITNKSIKVDLSSEDLNQFIFEGKDYEVFFDDCGIYKKEEFPAFSVLLNSEKKGKLVYQEQLQFVRTKTGYKLILVALEKSK